MRASETVGPGKWACAKDKLIFKRLSREFFWEMTALEFFFSFLCFFLHKSPESPERDRPVPSTARQELPRGVKRQGGYRCDVVLELPKRLEGKSTRRRRRQSLIAFASASFLSALALSEGEEAGRSVPPPRDDQRPAPF